MRLKKALAVGVLLGGAALGGLFAYTKQYESQRHAAIAQAFQLTDAQTQVMRDCRASLARHERDFKDKVDPLRGCACVAQRITDHVPLDQYPAASQMLDILVERSKGATQVDLAEQIEASELIAPLPDLDTYRLVMNATSAVGYCGRAKNHARHEVAGFETPKAE